MRQVVVTLLLALACVARIARYLKAYLIEVAVLIAEHVGLPFVTSRAGAVAQLAVNAQHATLGDANAQVHHAELLLAVRHDRVIGLMEGVKAVDIAPVDGKHGALVFRWGGHNHKVLDAILVQVALRLGYVNPSLRHQFLHAVPCRSQVGLCRGSNPAHRQHHQYCPFHHFKKFSRLLSSTQSSQIPPTPANNHPSFYHKNHIPPPLQG